MVKGEEEQERGRCEDKERRRTKEEVITAQREPDESAVMAGADGAPLPNEQVSLMRNAK